MPGHEDLIEALARLDPAALEEVVTAAYRQRAGGSEAVDLGRPDLTATADEFARWVAQRHLASDAALDRVVYLPTGSPADEIRLLEINRFLNGADPDPIEPLDFTPETDSPFRVFVADITSGQWERVRNEPDKALPAGWRLPDNRVFVRG